MKKIVYYLIVMGFFFICGNVKAMQYYSEECDVFLEEHQVELALILTDKDDIINVDCDNLNYASNYVNDSIKISEKSVPYYSNQIRIGIMPLATDTIYNINYSITKALNSSDNKYHTIVIVTHPNTSAIYSKGKWNFLNTSWSNTTSRVTSEILSGYYKVGSTRYDYVIPSGNSNTMVNKNVPITYHDVSLSHQAEMIAYKTPDGSVNYIQFKMEAIYSSEPQNSCMGHYFVQPSSIVNPNPSTQQWYMLQKGFSLFNDNVSQTNSNFYFTNLCV